MGISEKAVVLISGGIDSAVCLWWARKLGLDIFALTFNYHHRNPLEIRAAERLAEAAPVKEYRVIGLPFLKEVIDCPPAGLGRYDRNVPDSYVPARNIVFYGAAAGWAEALDASWIIGGHNRLDQQQYPDSRPEFIEAMNRAVKLGTFIGGRKPLSIITPLAVLSKVEVVKMALELSVPLHLTWSCHGNGEKACGHCDACRLRREAFNRLGIEDPAEYGINRGGALNNITI
ncbi:MAG: 7-cyano-7-deazaguanine synthase QueC [Thaumarchaeota archaeon]|nr:7-cyano-7-deazaguanine synthase QueC [Nitrososphaerota archaeon]MCL5316696.1 7-cyano-7-deazaguanine synthase QueC [Nitrososphaerota archaeon]